MYGDFRTVYFITLTFSPEFYEKFQIEVPGSNSFSKRRVSNDGVSRAVRLFLERYRKRYGRSLRHFFVTERGEKGGRLHLHGLIFDPEFTLHLESSKYSGRVVSKPYDLLQLNKAFAEIWSYGFTYFEPITQKTVNYVTKYITKYYDYDKEFIPKIFVSPGFGSCFCRNRQMVDWTKKISGKDGRFCYVASVLRSYKRNLKNGTLQIRSRIPKILNKILVNSEGFSYTNFRITHFINAFY
jgi:hypothetical protein